MRLARRARNILRRNGIEVSRYFAELDWERNFLRQLQSHRVSAVLDVGANSGQYARGLRGAGFAGRIVSFEPLPGPFAVLQRSASTDPLWECRRCALGDVDGTISINVAGNEGASSSVLPMLKRHQDAFPPANYVGAQRVPIHRLDSVAADVLRPNDIAFLKIDVQGFEKQVIAGGDSTCTTDASACSSSCLSSRCTRVACSSARRSISWIRWALRSRDCNPVSPTPATVECCRPMASSSGAAIDAPARQSISTFA